MWAYRPDRRRPDLWYHIDVADLHDGNVLQGDQCDVCALSAYTLRRYAADSWAAVCEGQRWDGEVIAGCRTQHPVRQMMAMRVIR